MAKMFYTLEEAAEKLGVSPDQVKQMASSGQIQQFRDRDKLMFKREQVDAQAGSAGEAANDDTSIPLADDTSYGEVGDAVNLPDDAPDQAPQAEDPRESTGISVFDADEVDAADPAAQTQVTHSPTEDEDIALESVGSGSGLLDLTRESDDTSLGAELLDEIYPGSSGDTGTSQAAAGTGLGSSGIFADATAAGDTGQGATGMQQLESPGEAPLHQPQTAAMAVRYEEDESDPAWSGACTGMLIGASVALILAMLVVAAEIIGVQSPVAELLGGSTQRLLISSAVVLLGSFVLGIIGLGIGRAVAR